MEEGGGRVTVLVCVFVHVQIGISPCKQLEVSSETAVKMNDNHPLSSIVFSYHLTHTHFLSISAFFSIVSLPCPHADLLCPL